ncbi:hypothetical protein [Halomonas sp.]|uniref:hypothetical protein n=1 Tax=Halomonas sp. TaxID=1486246 RepID=UPI0035674859
MQPTDIAHLAGIFDASGTITVHISEEESYAIGYRYKPMLRMHRPPWDGPLMGKLDEYCEENHVRYWVNDDEREADESYEFVVTDPHSIVNFLDPMLEYFVTKYEPSIVMGDILAGVAEDKHKTKAGLIELAEKADELREYSRHGPDSKHTAEYFRSLWKNETNGIS